MGHLHQVRVDVASGVDPLYAICVAIGSLKAAREWTVWEICLGTDTVLYSFVTDAGLFL